MDVREKLVGLLDDITATGYKLLHVEERTDERYEEIYDSEDIADHLIAHGVTVQECTPKCWDVCNNNGNIQYRCPHCETVYVYMYKNHIAPDVCKECGARLYLPQPPKGE